ncbi:DUF6134 family protein [Bizionia arctica]|uniref:T9SS C-terminal target domain-containing protein n=1 Tax=Bizionia arctica TaxID=1495645 RepID=A0A917GL09_9FLAO|nr:DUF6134 family protein [Bizionia arctica]GGG49427.1 hypothetical protein GCM10010976_20950 [Bizionia arctica]
MKNLFYLLFILLSGTCIKAQVTTLNYNIVVAGENVGTLVATKTIQEGKITFDTNSTSTIDIFGKTTITTSLVVVYRKDVLESSVYTVEKDGSPYDSTTITENNGTYSINRKGAISSFPGPITASANQLYFNEPKGISKMFAELEGIYKDITETGDNAYLFTDPDHSHKNTYTYENGILKEGIIDHALFNFSIILIK